MSRAEIIFDYPAFNHASDFEQRVRKISVSWDLGETLPKDYNPDSILITSVWIAKCGYSHTPPDVQLHIALFGFLAFFVDDLAIPLLALESFMEKFYSNSPQLHPILDLLVDNMLSMDKYFTPFSKKLIIKSTIDFVNMTAFEQGHKAMTIRPASSAFATLKRLCNGLPEAYYCFVFDKFTFPNVSSYVQALPDGGAFICYANDIFSFYKEEIAHETTNFVHDLSVAAGIDVVTSLKKITDDALDAITRTRLILTGEAEKHAWGKFMAGYVAFHYVSPRYRLQELTVDVAGK